VCVNSTIDINFDTGVDVNGQSSGDLVFRGSAGFEVHFTDDGSSGSHGSADGVRISNQNDGNIFVGSSNNLVLGANDAMSGAETKPTTTVPASLRASTRAPGLSALTTPITMGPSRRCSRSTRRVR